MIGMRTYIRTYGCTLNQADSDIMQNILTSNGIYKSDQEKADVVIVNTCTVKTPTERKILEFLAHMEAAKKKMIVMGCMASANQDLIERFAPSASIVTASNMHMICSAVNETANGRRIVSDSYAKNDSLKFFSHEEGVIARVPTNYGCLSSCSFCETKFARGPLNSFPEETIINAVSQSVRNGAKEIQLTSQDMGAYGIERRTNITELMKKISGLDGDFRVRIGMLNPEHLGRQINELIEALQSDKFYKFIHIPVQSGSDEVLKSMRRNYTVGQFKGFVDLLRDSINGITIETDLIIGYPTETKQDFKQTLEFIKEVKPDVTNISKFTPRPHAIASKLKQRSQNVIKSRCAEASRVVREVQHNINDRFIGKCLDVITTEKSKISVNGRTESYKQVVMNHNQDKNTELGLLKRVLIYTASANVLYGRIVG